MRILELSVESLEEVVEAGLQPLLVLGSLEVLEPEALMLVGLVLLEEE